MKIFNNKDNYSKIKSNTVIPSGISDKDKGLKEIISISDTFQSEYISKYPELVFNQDKSPICVNCSIALIRHIQIYKKYGINIIPDVLYNYSKRNSDMYQGDGVIPKEALQSLMEYGIPEITENIDKYLSTLGKGYKYKDLKEIYDNKSVNILDRDKIYGYYRLSTINEIKTALLNFSAVTAMFRDHYSLYLPKKVAGLRAYIDFSKYQYDTSKNYQHQMTIIGWRNTHWIVQNSWGKNYGINGIVYIPMDYPITEAWAIVDKIDNNNFGIYSKE